MPITLVDANTLPPSSRESKIAKTLEWGELISQLQKGIPRDQVIRLTFSLDTLKVFRSNAKKVATAFCIKLRADKQLNNKYRFSAIGEEVRVSNKAKEKK